MGHRSPRHLGLLSAVTLVVVWAVVSAPDSAGAVDLTVQGRSDLSFRARSIGARLEVDGRLRDDRGRPLARRRIGLTVEGESGGRAVAEQAVETDERGRFRAVFGLEPGTYAVEAVFESTSHVRGQRVETNVEVEPEPVELRLEGPEVVGAGATPVDLRVRATAAGRGVGVPVVLQSGGRERRHELSPRGSGEFDVAGMLSPGDNRIEAVVPATEHRERVAATHQIRLVDEPKVEVRASTVFERLQRGIAVDVSVSDTRGPVDGMGVEVVMERLSGEGSPGESPDGGASGEERPSSSGETDDTGGFRAFFGRDDLTDGEWRPTVTISPDVGASVTSRPDPVELDRTASRYVVRGAAGLALLAVLFVVGREGWLAVRARLRERRERLEEERRREEAFEETEALEPEALEEVPEEADVPTEGEGRRLVSGVVWDVWRGEVVEGATVRAERRGSDGSGAEVTTDRRGWFELDDLESGDWQLVIDAPGFVRADCEFDVPHGGDFAAARFDVVAVPLKIRRLYRSLASFVESRDPWGDLSPREIRDAIVTALEARDLEEEDAESEVFARRVAKLVEVGEEELDSGRDYVRALTDIVEETNFSGRTYGRPTWEFARRLALRIRELVEEDGDE